MMRQRQLGTQGLRVAEIGLGCAVMSGLYAAPDRGCAVATLQRALELGVDFFDTADIYGLGHNERLIRDVLGAQRERIVLATKFGAVASNDGRGYTVNGRADYVAQAIDASLLRLGTDSIDLYYQHRIDPLTPIEETVGAMARLVEAGKIRYLGLCECSADTLRRAHAIHPISVLQAEYSLFSREPEATLLPACEELGIGFVAYSPLGRGLLTGTVRDAQGFYKHDHRRVSPRFAPDNLPRNLELVNGIQHIAAQIGCSAGQVVLAWTLRHARVVPIPGTQQVAHLEQNVAAAAVELSDALFRALDELVPPNTAAGARYPADELARVQL